MSISKKHCTSYAAIFILTAQTSIDLIFLLLGFVTEPLLIQTVSFFISFLVFLANEILHPRDSSITYIVSLITILPGTIMTKILCIHGIHGLSNIKSEIESTVLREPYSNSSLLEYNEGAKLAIAIIAAILYIVNGTALTYLWLSLITTYYFKN